MVSGRRSAVDDHRHPEMNFHESVLPEGFVVIIMINGSFGVGKTTTAEALLARLPHAIIFDPESVGHLARYITAGLRSGAEDTDDFQDIRIWPPLTVATARQLFQAYNRPLIVPMTLVNPAYLDPIRTGFGTIAPVYHFCLVASLSTIQQRLQARGDGPEAWTIRKAEQYVPQLSAPYYATHLDTEQHSVAEVVDSLLAGILGEGVKG
jgi:hypothetical protein